MGLRKLIPMMLVSGASNPFSKLDRMIRGFVGKSIRKTPKLRDGERFLSIEASKRSAEWNKTHRPSRQVIRQVLRGRAFIEVSKQFPDWTRRMRRATAMGAVSNLYKMQRRAE